MTAREHTLRIMDNNLAIRSSSHYSYSSQDSSYPFSNSQLNLRAKYWQPTGYFLINSSNDKIYINDGTNKTITLTDSATAYTTPALLAAHIQTQLNASSSNWTCTYSNTTFKFTIANSASKILRLSQTSSAAWNTLGFTTNTNITGTSFTANSQRNHSSEFVRWDLGGPRDVNFFAMICPIDEIFSVSETATFKLEANNVDDFTSPPLSVTITRTDSGGFLFLDDQTDYSYRYWRVKIVDPFNPAGPTGFKISHIYLGDYFTFAERTVSYGYSKGDEDRTQSSDSENGTKYFDEKIKRAIFDGINLNIITRAQKDTLQSMFNVFGISNPFYISIDPLGLYTDSISELTKFVYFKEQPRFNHVMRDFFTTSLSFYEVI